MMLVKVENVNGTLVTTSNRVADELNVNHRDLLEKIDKYINRFSSALTMAQFYIQSTYKTKNSRTVKNYLITKKGIEMIIQHSTFTRASQSIKIKEIYKLLGGNDIETISVHSRFELSFIDMLEEALGELNVNGYKQYKVGKYRLDYYIPKFNLAIEYDEEQHFTKTNYLKDKEREWFIKDKLNCKFIRCNYKDSNIVNVMKIIKEMM